MTSIPVLLAEGLVFQDGALLRCETDGQAIDLDFSQFEGQKIYGFIAHIPTPRNKGSWGFGSCALEPSGKCPFGHHHAPHRLLLWQRSEEVFEREEDWWNVRQSGNFPRREFLIGHRCKILMCPTSIPSGSDPVSMGQQLQSLSELLEKLRKAR